MPLEGEAERLAPLRLVGPQILARNGAADLVEIGCDLAGDVAAIEILEAGARQLLEGGGQRRKPADDARLGVVAVDEIGRGEIRLRREIGGIARAGARLAGRDRDAVARVADRVGEQIRQRQARAHGGGEFMGEHPAADGAGHGQGGVGAAGGDDVDLKRAVALDRRPCAGEPAGLDGPHAALGFVDQPETVAADAVHVRIDDGDRRGHREHGLDGVAALGDDVATRFRGEAMGGGRGGAGKDLCRTHGASCCGGSMLGIGASSWHAMSVRSFHPWPIPDRSTGAMR